MGKSVEIVRGVYEALGKGDVPAVLGALDPRIDWREAEGFLYADGNPYVGPQAVNLDGFAVIPENIIDGGDTVVVEGRYKGTMNATGRPVDAQFAHVWEIAGDKVVRFQQYTDTAQWREAAGT